MRMRETADEQVFEVAGRGELHLTILLENMRREGYEMAVSRPRVLFKDVGGERLEPYEMLSVDIEDQNQGAIMEELGRRKGDLQDMQPDGKGRVRLEYRIPARGLIGFQGEFMTLTRGTGLMSHVFDDYGPVRAGEVGERRNGVLISQDDGEAVAYALWKLQERGRMFVSPGDKLYEGHDHRHQFARQRSGRQSGARKEADQRARIGQGRAYRSGAADRVNARICGRIHCRR